MQKVKMYYEMFEAYKDMNSYIEKGWRIHICTMSCYTAGYTSKEKVLVVYEK